MAPAQIEAQHQQFSVQWEFMGAATQEHFDAAQAVADAMETLETTEVTMEVIESAMHRLRKGWNPQSVLAVIENCSFDRIESNTKDKNMMAPAPEITRKALDAGKIVHTGWTPNRDTADQCGVNVSDYFDLTGKFLGPDENGLAPTFKRA